MDSEGARLPGLMICCRIDASRACHKRCVVSKGLRDGKTTRTIGQHQSLRSLLRVGASSMVPAKTQK